MENNIMNLEGLNKYMIDNNFVYVEEKQEELSANDKFTQLLLNDDLDNAIIMIDSNKDLKLNRDVMNRCDGCTSTCNGYFNSLIQRICLNNNFINVIKLLQFLIPENIISSLDYDPSYGICYQKCETLIHNYTDYCYYCINGGYIHTARAIYIMFEVNNTKLLEYVKSNNRKKDIVYDIMMKSQNIIPLKRRFQL
jgi:hypothetical protein